MDHRIFRIRNILSRVGVVKSEHVSREFDDRHVHAVTDAEIGNFVFPRVLDRGNFPFDPARAEPARAPGCRSIPVKHLLRALLLDVLG